MTRFMLALGLVIGLGSAAHADDDEDYGRAGRRGTVTAYELDGRTVIAHRICVASGRNSWRYADCGSRLRDRVKSRLCARLGKGTHRFSYQIGDARPTRSSIYCGRND